MGQTTFLFLPTQNIENTRLENNSCLATARTDNYLRIQATWGTLTRMAEQEQVTLLVTSVRPQRYVVWKPVQPLDISVSYANTFQFAIVVAELVTRVARYRTPT